MIAWKPEKKCSGLYPDERGGEFIRAISRPERKGGSGRVATLCPPEKLFRQVISIVMFAIIAASDVTTTKRMMFFISICSTPDLAGFV